MEASRDLINMTGIPSSDSMGLVLGLEESWQSSVYEDCILDMARGGCAMGHGHHKPYLVQSEYVARTVNSRKESSVREHGVMMLSLVEKLKDLQADFDKEETYVDVILQSLPPSYDQFIINYNMNGLEKSLHELIKMLVQYEATIEKFAPSVLVGEALTFKAKGKVAGREKRKKDEMSSTTASTSSVLVTPLGGVKERGRGFDSQRFQRMFAFIAERRAIGRGSVLSSSPMKVKMRSRKAKTRRSPKV
ncbi:hypothetical protein Sango_2886900 [Sesamum angolense]|uniref:Uncharacterized protein n=1 Tax=Sesamum angolense TaxID=2727404 RepID=A0AAE1VZ40_9LAMI|nr:hypothetical protein Sango_2886900 [Sesamum angolense]